MGTARNIQLDAIRGLLLVLMTFDHILLWPYQSWMKVHTYSYNPLGYFSAAEGFFFISGLLAGVLSAQSPTRFLDQLPKRILKMYLVNLSCILLVTACMGLLPEHFSSWGEHPWLKGIFQQPWQAAALSTVFLSSGPFFDILQVYCLFFLGIPLIISLIRQGKSHVLFIGSLTLFLFGQFAPLQHLESFLQLHLSPAVVVPWFDIFSWQLLFTIAVACGYFFGSGKLWPSLKTPTDTAILLVSAFCVFCFVVRHKILGFGNIFEEWSDVRTLEPFRLLNFLAAAFLVRSLLIRTHFLQVPILARLGRQSLSVFTYHSLLVYFLGLFMDDINAMSFWPKLSLLFLSILSLWAPALIFENKATILRQQRQV